MTVKQVRPNRNRSEEERAKERERKHRTKERDKRNRTLVKQMGLTDDKGDLLKPGKEKSTMQRANEARQELQQQVLDLYVAGMAVDDIAIALHLHLGQTKRLIEEGKSQTIQTYAQASPAENFAKYAYFHMRTIQRLDKIIDQFLEDPDSKQYNATVQALRARSDLLDKVYAKGKSLGVMNLTKAAPERGMTGEVLVEALMRERRQLDAVIAELKITVTEKIITAKVKRAPKSGVEEVSQGDRRTVTVLHPDEGIDPQRKLFDGTCDLLSGAASDTLAAEIIRERIKAEKS